MPRQGTWRGEFGIGPIVEPRIQEEQCSFCPIRGTLEQLYTLHRELEGLWEFAQPVHMCFVDLEKAFDHVPRGILWGVLHASVARGRTESGLGTTEFHLCFLQMMLSCWLHSSQDLQHVLGRSAAGMRISTSKSEAMVQLDRKREIRDKLLG
ncbi:hypothetical protein L3Q82_012346 [Scortum barcoo]|uniref:Uncharacterized protein n=1 Tax=Scortum barcoo TaxID=214431 RepID=A0ACB8W2N5_9TELE|nr:hypothetical protein L3Q82_012346 [Scortum barcoo]